MGNKIDFKIGLNDGYFSYLASLSLDAHHAIGEFIDNALFNASEAKSAQLALSVEEVDSAPDLIRITIADWGKGIARNEFTNVFALGGKPSNEGYLCLNGIGLKHALMTLSHNKYEWYIASKAPTEDDYNLVTGPLSTRMALKTGPLPCSSYIVSESHTEYNTLPSTVISVITSKEIASSMLRRKYSTSASKISVNTFRRALAEHLGVKYRGFLSKNCSNCTDVTRILLLNFVHNDGTKEDVFITPIHPPFKNQSTSTLMVQVEDSTVPVAITHGSLSEKHKDNLVLGKYDTQFYYLNRHANGFDIEVGNRTISTAQPEELWKVTDSKSSPRHIGIVHIDTDSQELVKKYFNFYTFTGKTEINQQAPGWIAVRKSIKNFRCMKPTNSKSHSTEQ